MALSPWCGSSTRGRDESSDIHLPVDTVSANHAELTRESGRWVLRDLRSGNGTFVNDVRITYHTLEPGDRVRFDCVNFRYEESVFRVGSHGTRVHGQLIEKEEERPQVTLSQIKLTPDIPIDSPSKRLRMRAEKPKNGAGKGLLFLVLLLAFIILSGVGYGAYLWLQANLETPDAISEETPADPP